MDWRTRGLDLFHAGRYQDALPFLERALQQDPRDGQLYLCLGIACATLGDLNRAQQYLLEAMRLRPQDALVHYNWACLLQGQGRLQEALAAFDHSVRLDPGLIAARVAADNIRRSMGYQVSGAMPLGAPIVVRTPNQNRGTIYSIIGLVFGLLSICSCPPLGMIGMLFGALAVSKGDRTFGSIVILLSFILTLASVIAIRQWLPNL